MDKYGISPNISLKSSVWASWPKRLHPLCFWTLLKRGHTLHATPIHTPISRIYKNSYETRYFFHPNRSCILVWRMYSHTKKVTVVLPQDDPSSIRSKACFVPTTASSRESVLSLKNKNERTFSPKEMNDKSQKMAIWKQLQTTKCIYIARWSPRQHKKTNQPTKSPQPQK